MRRRQLLNQGSVSSSQYIPAAPAAEPEPKETPKAVTKRALLTGLRNGNLEKAVEKMEADEAAEAAAPAVPTRRHNIIETETYLLMKTEKQPFLMAEQEKLLIQR